MHNPVYKNRRHQVMCVMAQVGERGLTAIEAVHDLRLNGLNPKTITGTLTAMSESGYLRREPLHVSERRSLARKFGVSVPRYACRYYYIKPYTPSYVTGVDRRHAPRMFKGATIRSGRLIAQTERLDSTPCNPYGMYFRTQEDAFEFASFILENLKDFVPPVSTRSKQPKTPIGTSLNPHSSDKTTFKVGSVVPKGKRPVYLGLSGKLGPSERRKK